MRGVRAALVAVLLLSSLGCGSKALPTPQVAEDPEGQNPFLTRQILPESEYYDFAPKDPRDWLSYSNRYFLRNDTDKDGIPDRKDEDIDGDGIPNYIDSHPLDRTHGFEDEDGDGLPDFIDYRNRDQLRYGATQELADLQEFLWSHFKIYLAHDDVLYTPEEVRWIRFLFEDPQSENLLRTIESGKSLRVIVKSSRFAGAGGISGSYDEDWKSLKMANLTKDPQPELKFLAVFVHEFFHAVAANQPGIFKEFTQITTSFNLSDLAAWSEIPEAVAKVKDPAFPSKYAKISRPEHFAEAGWTTFLLQTQKNYPQGVLTSRISRFREMGYAPEEFEQTPLYAWFVKTFF